jgi:hypothetical protein
MFCGAGAHRLLESVTARRSLQLFEEARVALYDYSPVQVGGNGMATRSGITDESMKDGSNRIYKKVSRSYIIAGIGIIIGALGLRPSSINAAGITLSIDNPKIIQGCLYLLSLIYTVGVLLNLQNNNTNPYLRRDALRVAVWNALPKGTRSFRGMTHNDFLDTRKRARLAIKGISAFTLSIAIIPALFVILFNPLILLRAIGNILGIL